MPWNAYGVKLQRADIDEGFEFWLPCGDTVGIDMEQNKRLQGAISKEKESHDLKLEHATENEGLYNAALQGLSATHAPRLTAVVSLHWPHRRSYHHDNRWCIYLPKRVWLTVYRGDQFLFQLPNLAADLNKTAITFIQDRSEGEDRLAWQKLFEKLLAEAASRS